MGKFASTGVVVGQTRRDRRAQVSENKSGNSVTMGKSVPRQNEGKVGDITVREITNVGLRCYIKSNSGWYDINSLGSSGKLTWNKVAYNATYNWTDYDSDNQVKYAKDSNGFVHLRGQGKTASASNAGDTIFTLPVGFRPYNSVTFPITVGNLARAYISTLRIQSNGNVDVISSANTTETANRVVFDGLSFFSGATQVVSFGGGTSTGGGSGGGGGGAHGGGAGGGA